jgi:hypothetical protein
MCALQFVSFKLQKSFCIKDTYKSTLAQWRIFHAQKIYACGCGRGGSQLFLQGIMFMQHYVQFVHVKCS